MVRVAGREYNGLLSSPCFLHQDEARQMSCASCHLMHQEEEDPRTMKEWANDQLRFGMDSNRPDADNNKACTQCHTAYAKHDQLVEHTHHQAKSSGSQCYNCHMPHTMWGLIKASRSHTISSPLVAESLSPIGRPNACNLCHLDKTFSWTAEQLFVRYGQTMPELTAEQKSLAAGVIWALKGDAMQRVLAAWSMGWGPARDVSGDDWTHPFLAQLLDDPYTVVRSVAHQSLKVTGRFDEVPYDYLGDHTQRESAIQAVRKIWNSPSSKKGRAADDALLINSDRAVRKDEFERLLKERNDRRVYIVE